METILEGPEVSTPIRINRTIVEWKRSVYCEIDLHLFSINRTIVEWKLIIFSW